MDSIQLRCTACCLKVFEFVIIVFSDQRGRERREREREGGRGKERERERMYYMVMTLRHESWTDCLVSWRRCPVVEPSSRVSCVDMVKAFREKRGGV
jgi:hypothetical protein